MSFFGWLSIAATVALAWFVGYAIGRSVEGAPMDRGFIASGGIAALIVYGIAWAVRNRSS